MKERHLKWLFRNGLRPKQVGIINEVLIENEREQIEKSFVLWTALGINILGSEGYWPKSKWKTKRFIADIFELWNSIDMGAVDWVEVMNLVESTSDLVINFKYFEIAGKTASDMIQWKEEPPKGRKKHNEGIRKHLSFQKLNDMTVEEALDNLKARYQSPDIKWAVTALEEYIERRKVG